MIRVVAFLLLAGTAQAFTVSGGISVGCHEEITEDAVLATVLDWDLVPSEPPSLTRSLVLDATDPAYPFATRLALWSTVTGVRFNDLHGAGISYLQEIRNLHYAVEDQDAHCLRRVEDDGLAGNQTALIACRDYLEAELTAAHDAFLNGPTYETVPVFVEFYGTLDVYVWSAYFHLGRALHALQDHYAHGLWNDDVTELYSVTNFVECVGVLPYDEERDGPCHSNATDRCFFGAEPIAAAANTASRQLILALRAWVETGDRTNLDALLDGVLAVRGDCDLSNQYCGTSWYAFANRDTSKARDVVRLWELGCAVTPGRSRAWPLLLLAALLLVWRGTRIYR